MVLQVVDGNHSASLLDELGVSVHATGTLSLLVDLSDLQDILETIQSNLDDLVVHRLEQVTHRLDAALGDEVSNLVGLLQTTGSSVGDRPTSLLLGLEVGILKDVNERWDDVATTHSARGQKRAACTLTRQ